MVTDQEKGALLAFIRSHNTKTKKETNRITAHNKTSLESLWQSQG